MLGYLSASELKGVSIFEFIQSQDVERAGEAFKELLNTGEIIHFETILNNGKGMTLPVEVNGRAVRSPIDGTKIVHLITRDISARRKMEEFLRESESKYKSLIENINDAVYEIDSEGCVVYISPRIEQLIGFTQDDLKGLNVLDRITPRDRAVMLEILSGKETGSSRYFEARYSNRSGNPVWLRISLRPVYEGDMVVGGRGTLSDITEQKEKEEQLNVLSQAVEQSPMSIIITGSNRKIEYINSSVCTATGYSREELIGADPNILHTGLNQPDYYERVGRKLAKGETWNGAFQNRKKNGETYWISTSIAPVLNRDGEIAHFIAINEDISDRIEMNREIKINEERLVQATELSGTIVWERDTTGLYTYISSGIKNILGFEAADIIGKVHFWELTPPEERAQIKAKGLDYIAKGELINNFDNPLTHIDGSIKWVSTSGCPVRDDHSRIIGYRGADVDITERRETADKLIMFRNVADQANYGVTIATMEGVIIYTNSEWTRMHGMDDSEADGKSFSVFHSEWQLPQVTQAMETLRNEGSILSVELWHRRKDGSEFPTLMNGSLIYDVDNAPMYFSATAIDISGLKKRDLEIKTLSTALEQSPVALVITDLNGFVEYASPAIKDMTGFDPAELSGQEFSVMKPGATPDAVYKDLWSTIESGKVWKGELTNQRKNGELYPESLVVCPVFNEQGVAVNYIAIKDDLTLRKQAEDEKIARKAAEKANRAKSVFLSNMSHEIRTPLNAILGFSQLLLKDREIGEDQKKRLNTIFRSGEHLFNLINDILDISKIESGRVSIIDENFSLKNLLGDLELMFKFQTREKGLAFNVEQLTRMPEFIVGDEKKIRQILINLLGNALKFTKAGGITLSLSSFTAEERHWIRMKVADTGSGIEAGHLANIFESFAQTRTGRDAGGTGLGLAISRNLAELMGGSLVVESEKGQGSTFTLEVPFIPEDSLVHDKEEDDYSRVVMISEESRPCRILIADDVEVNRILLLELLEPLGFETKTAENGAEVLNLLENWMADAVLMDLRMPVMDGYEATKEIHRIYGNDYPVIAITASAFEVDEKVSVQQIFTDYIKKPFRLEILLQVLKEVLGIKYLFNEEPAASSFHGSRQIDRERAQILPAEFRRTFLDALEQGEIQLMIDSVSSLQEEYPEEAQSLKILLDGYDYETLLHLFYGSEDGK